MDRRKNLYLAILEWHHRICCLTKEMEEVKTGLLDGLHGNLGNAVIYIDVLDAAENFLKRSMECLDEIIPIKTD